MSLRKLPAVRAFDDMALDLSLPPAALDRWNAGTRANEAGADNVISIYDVIGEDPWTGDGVTVKRAAAALRQIGGRPVTVNINSPGGARDQGLAIYNLLREHAHEVT